MIGAAVDRDVSHTRKESMDPNVKRSWEEFLNPEVMRPRLIAASLYIAGFETLKDAVVHRIRDFFWTGFNNSGDKIDPKYEADVLSRNKSPVYASLDWLKEMDAIDEADVETFNRVKAYRNKLAHDRLSTLGSEGLPDGFDECFTKMVALLRKIEVWWITNVEIPTDPDFDGRDVDEEGIVPGSIMTIQLLCDIALGDGERSRFYYDEFRKRSGGG
jgi:hypothetical protein